MNLKILRAAVFGGIAFFLIDWIVYGDILNEYAASNTNQCANRPMDELVWWAWFVSRLSTALLLTIILKWSGAKGIADGLKTGAVTGFLIALSIDLSVWSRTTLFSNFGALLVDLFVYTMMTAIVGLIIILFWDRDKSK